MQIHKKLTFEYILKDNKDKIYRICTIYAVSPVEPEDLFQEVVIHIWQAFQTFKGKSDVNTWIYRITLNVCLRYKERLQKKNHKTVRLDSIHFEPEATSPDIVQKEKHKALFECIQVLDKENQSIVILNLDEKSHREISKITGLTENHVAVKLKRIRKALLSCITSKLTSNE